MHEWFTQKGKLVPNLEDVLKQAKGVRLLEEQRAYMRQYREDKRNDSKVSKARVTHYLSHCPRHSSCRAAASLKRQLQGALCTGSPVA